MNTVFSDIVDRFSASRILCIGDVMLDKFVYGNVDRISPEAPIPVFAIKEERSMLGGAGNVARNLTTLGGHVSFVSVIGNDKVGRDIAAMIGKTIGMTPHMLTETDRISTTKTRFIAGMQQVLRADQEVLAAISEESSRRLLDVVASEIDAHDVVILSDYGKGVLTRPTLSAIIALAKAHKKPILVDPKSRDLSMYAGATCVSPNLKELTNATTRELHTDDDIIAAARELITQHDIDYMLVTRGKHGMTLVSSSGEATHIPVRAREVYDVSGAGDTAIATLALSVAAGATMLDAATLANLAAGIVVGRLGTATISADDIRSELFAEEHHNVAHKIVPLSAAIDHMELWKREGKKVAFTNGCFDLMHTGHLTLLHRTRMYCDKLVVGVNSDASVKRLKGEQRPVNNENERALLLASLSAVDQVIIFTEDTPLTLIEALKPDVLAKGSDYQKHQVVGHEIVEAYGGEIVLVPIKEGFSTTNTIKKLK